jgi:hypothetical protein
VCLVANPFLEAPYDSNQFVPDPIMQSKAQFDNAVQYILDALFCRLPHQVEPALSDPRLATGVRLMGIWEPNLPDEPGNALVGQDSASNQLWSRRLACRDFVRSRRIEADVIFAVSSSATHTRATTWYATDNDAAGGVGFTYDQQRRQHCYETLVPGCIALHVSSTSLTALHEFQHAMSSYTNGALVDLYVDCRPDINCRNGRPIPPLFVIYNGQSYQSDLNRDSIGYPPGSQRYHSEAIDPGRMVVMDNYWNSTPSEACANDKLTRQFVLDRILAKMSRPASPAVASTPASSSRSSLRSQPSV